MNRADLHFHLLAGVDDGPADLADSIELARAAVADGTRTVVATPHFRADLGLTDARQVRDSVREVRAALNEARVPLHVRCGAELGHDLIAGLAQAELELLAQGPPGARWVLVETPFEGMGPDFHAATDELRRRGFGTVIAHPERSADASEDAAAGLRRELDAGARSQLNAQSLTGDHGPDARAAAWHLLAHDLVDIVASDAHGPTRPPALSAARDALVAGGVAAAAADSFVGRAPRSLLAAGIPAVVPLAA